METAAAPGAGWDYRPAVKLPEALAASAAGGPSGSAPEGRRRTSLEWSGRDGRVPVWLWVGLATMFFSVLHIIIDFGVGLFDLGGTLSVSEAATLLGVALIQLWWAISFMAGARGNGSGVASAGILGAGWSALTNGFPIVYCPPVCEEARPLSDVAHVGSIAFGILLALVAIWSLWRARVRPGWFMPAVAAALVLGTIVSLANTPIT
jgi:hypothetical protein